MDLNSIKYVVTIAEEGSFSKASKKLYISQPALSQYIKNIETELNAPIFFRNTHSVELTPLGKIIVDGGKELLEKSNEFFSKIAYMAESVQNKVRFGIADCYSRFYLPKILSGIAKDCPYIKVEVMEAMPELLEPAVINNEIDFCLTPADPQFPKLLYETLYDEEIILAVPGYHPYNLNNPEKNSDDTVSISNFKDDTFVLKKGAPKLSKLILSVLFEEAGFYPKKIFETINWDTVNTMVNNDVGVGFIPKPLIECSNKEKKTKYYRIESSHSTFRKYAIAYMRDSVPSTAVKSVIKCIKNVF